LLRGAGERAIAVRAPHPQAHSSRESALCTPSVRAERARAERARRACAPSVRAERANRARCAANHASRKRQTALSEKVPSCVSSRGQPKSLLVSTVDAARRYTQPPSGRGRVRGPLARSGSHPARPTPASAAAARCSRSRPDSLNERCSSSAPASPLAAALRALNNASRPPSPASPLFMYTPGADAPREPLFVRHVREAGP